VGRGEGRDMEEREGREGKWESARYFHLRTGTKIVLFERNLFPL